MRGIPEPDHKGRLWRLIRDGTVRSCSAKPLSHVTGFIRRTAPTHQAPSVGRWGIDWRAAERKVKLWDASAIVPRLMAEPMTAAAFPAAEGRPASLEVVTLDDPLGTAARKVGFVAVEVAP